MSIASIAPLDSHSPTDIPRPEYPRPQFVRAEWKNLNGPWKFRLDDANVGLEQRWFDAADFEAEILVPFAMESPLSGVGDRSFHPCVWYQRTFSIPSNWEGRCVRLNFGAVDYRATVWVNGTVVAWHEGGHTPFSCDITGALSEEDNVLMVRAEDPPTDRYIPRGKQHWEPQAASIFYARTTGIWQTVWLEPVSPSHLESIRITPSVDGIVSVTAKISVPGQAQFVTMSISDDTRALASAMSLADGPGAALSAQIPEPKLWSPDQPHLYILHLELHGPTGLLDSVDSYFGVRSVAAQDGKVLLNGIPIYLKTVLDQGYWPESNLTPPVRPGNPGRHPHREGTRFQWSSQASEGGRSALLVLGGPNGPSGRRRDGQCVPL